MGALVSGVWQAGGIPATDGKFQRASSSFRDIIAPGTRFAPEPGRYRLYVSLACPWAHRTLVVRALKGLEDALPVSIVDPFMGENGWAFSQGPGCVPDPVFGARFLHEIYTHARADYTGRVTVPVLWDTRERTIVNNESADIVRILNEAFDPWATHSLPDLYPLALREEIDRVNARVYETVNDGVYRAGFAGTQAAYETAVHALFETLSDLEKRLATQRYLVGDALTEADVRLFTTLVRFDAVYYAHFKCNVRRLVDYPALWAFARSIFQRPEVLATVSFEHIKQHYYRSHLAINPRGIVPVGPDVDWLAPFAAG